jgi:hypothetical protein
MSKIRIAVPGYESFDGYLGTLEFKGGVSVREPTPVEITRIGANVKIVKVDGDEQIGPAANMVNSRFVSAKLEAPLQREREEPKVEDTKPDAGYTREQLEAIADKGGIKAIRKVGDEFGVKGVSIGGMIDEILQAQAEQNKVD